MNHHTSTHERKLENGCRVARWAEREGNPQAGRWQGVEHGGEVSGFVVAADVGAGPDLHHHPYGETFVVLEGQGRFTVDDKTIDVTAGDLVSVASGVPHRFCGLGPGQLRLVAIHAAPRIEQTDVHGPVTQASPERHDRSARQPDAVIDLTYRTI